MSGLRIGWLPGLAVALFWPGAAAGQSAPDVPSPESVLGFEVGTAQRLADWEEITGYFNLLAAASDRVKLDTLGLTTLGRPFVALTISSRENLEQLDHYLDVQRRLADPRRIESEIEAAQLIREGRAIVMITAGIHSTEVGGYQMPMRLTYKLASGTDATTAMILDEVILLLVPSLNPDGSQMVVDWYESTLGEAWEGAGPPFLYHHYVGHDNNRDWYAFTQKETQLAVTGVHNVWHPQIVHDIHQMGSRGPRFFIPPWTDPVEPNVDPLLVAGINALGTAMAWQLYQQGKTGIVVNAIYDAWTPARAYQHYHGGVRILTETASARLGTPIDVPLDSLRTTRDGVDPRVSSWRMPEPWPGGEWGVADIVNYMEAGALALLEQAALYRSQWLGAFYQIGLRGLAGREGWPRAFVIPAERQNRDGLPELLRVLVTGDVEVRTAQDDFVLSGRRFPAGTYVVDMAQPYSGFAKTLLEAQVYPNLRQYPGGPPKAPYDVTAHTLPLMMEVEVVASEDLLSVELSDPIEVPAHMKSAPRLSGEGGTRVAIYESWLPSMDAGWTRWIFDEYEIEHEVLRDADARAGDLRSRFDIIFLPDGSPERIIAGYLPDSMPSEYVGGLGEEGVRALGEFVEAGGTLVAFNRSSALPIEHFDLPVANVLAEVDSLDFYVPGSILRLQLTPGHWLTDGMPSRSIAWFEKGLAFEALNDDDRVEIVGRYGEGDPLLSGWMIGAEHIAGRGAIAVVRHGTGHVVLFGFRPQYRAQTIATYPLIFNALRKAGAGTGPTDSSGGDR